MTFIQPTYTITFMDPSNENIQTGPSSLKALIVNEFTQIVNELQAGTNNRSLFTEEGSRSYELKRWNNTLNKINNFDDTEFFSKILEFFKECCLEAPSGTIYYFVTQQYIELFTDKFDTYVHENPSDDTFISMYQKTKTEIDAEKVTYDYDYQPGYMTIHEDGRVEITVDSDPIVVTLENV
jgi:hypothetical protein